MISTKGVAYAGILGWVCGRLAEHRWAEWRQILESSGPWLGAEAAVAAWRVAAAWGAGAAAAAAAVAVAAAAVYVCVAVLVGVVGEVCGELYVHRPLGSAEARQGGAGSSSKSPNGKAGTLPPPFPNAWFRLLLSRDLPVGRLVRVEALGQLIALYRGNDGVAYALHPHTPDFVPTASWHVHEANGLLHLWHDAEKRPPAWLPLDIAALPGVTAPPRLHAHSLHQVRAHIQELPENAADTPHPNALHRAFAVPPLRVLLRHAWEASCDPQPAPNEHLVLIRVRQHAQLLGWAVAPFMLDIHIHQVGPALVYLNFATPFGRVVIAETILPQAPLLQDVRHYAWAEPRVPRLLVKILFRAMLAQFERDLPDWNHRVYLPSPSPLKDDGPIPRYRRWFARFYSESSLRYTPLQLTSPPRFSSSSSPSHISCRDAIDW